MFALFGGDEGLSNRRHGMQLSLDLSALSIVVESCLG